MYNRTDPGQTTTIIGPPSFDPTEDTIILNPPLLKRGTLRCLFFTMELFLL